MAIFEAPYRDMSVTLPISLSGLTVLSRSTSSSGSIVGPILMPMGLLRPRKNSTCAPVSWRVRSPIQRKWAEVA